jgi:hypothetical protein
MPGVLLHPQPCVRMEEAHKRSHYRYKPNIDIPCAMVFDLLRALPGVHDLVSHRRSQITCDLNTSPGVPGPHAFAVRKSRIRLMRGSRPSHPASRFVTMRIRPSC